MLELYYVHMVYGTMNLNFTHKLLLSPALSQGGLLDDLSSQNAFSLLILELVALSEAALTQKLALEVLPDLYLSIILNYLLFYYGWLCTFHL